MESGISLVEWPWLMQPRLNWLPKILSHPISIWFRIGDLNFFQFILVQSIATALCAWENLDSSKGESLHKATFVSLRVKMKRFNIDLFIPFCKYSSVFWSSVCTLSHAALWDTTKVKLHYNFQKVDGSSQNSAVIKSPGTEKDKNMFPSLLLHVCF